MALSSVDLPVPLGPSSETSWPGAMGESVSFSMMVRLR